MEPSVSASKLTLGPLRVDHAVEMVEVLADASLYEFTGGEAPTLEWLEARYGMQIAGSGRPEEIWRNWIVRTVDDGRAIGFVQAYIHPEHTASQTVADQVGMQRSGEVDEDGEEQWLTP